MELKIQLLKKNLKQLERAFNGLHRYTSLDIHNLFYSRFFNVMKGG